MADGNDGNDGGSSSGGRRPPRAPLLGRPTVPLEVGASDSSASSQPPPRPLRSPSMATLAGAGGVMLQGDLTTPIHAKLQASLGSTFLALPSYDDSGLLPDEEEDEQGASGGGGSGGGSTSGSGSGSSLSRMAADAQDGEDGEQEEEELSPMRALHDMESGLESFPPVEEDENEDDDSDGGGDGGDDHVNDLDATRTRGRRHPSAAPSPPPNVPGMVAAMASAAPPPPLFPPVPSHGFAGGVADQHFFLPPAIATSTPLSSRAVTIPTATAGAAGTAGAATTGAGRTAGARARAGAVGAVRKKGLGTRHVLMTSAETMWGVLIFLRFGWCVGNVGLVPVLGAVVLSAACQSLCASSLSAVATNGLVTRAGGAYFMVVKALGLGPGGSVGFFYWLGMTALMAVELYGFAEGAELLVRYRYHHIGEELNPEPHVGEPPFTGRSSPYWDRVLLCFIGLFFLLAVRLLMRRQVRHRIVSVVVFIFFISLLSCCGGVLAALAGSWRPHGIAAAGYPWPSGEILVRNLLLPDDKVSFHDFRNVLSVIYPSFIGIFQGANLCSELRRPFQSIPRGTFGAIAASCLLYTCVFLVTALAAPSSVLREDTELLLRYAWPSPLMGYAGTMAVGLISALSCFEVSPRILQSLAEDRAVKILTDWEMNKLYSWGYRGQVPVRAILLTGLLAAPFLFLPSIELIARATAVCFLTMYASMNLACLLQSALRLHTWRPAFAYYSWLSALLGTLACLFLSFYLDGLISLLIFALAAILFVYIEVKSDVTVFGHGMVGLKYHLALTSLYGMEESLTANAVLGEKSPFWRRRSRYAAGTTATTTVIGAPAPSGLRRTLSPQPPSAGAAAGAQPVAAAATSGGGYWRPQILVYLPATDLIIIPGASGSYIGDDGNGGNGGGGGGGDGSRKRQLLSFVGQLKASRGLTIGATVMVEDRNLLEDIRRSRSTLALHTDTPSAAAQSLASLLAAEQEKAAAVKRQIMGSLAREGILGFAEVVSCPDLRTGLSALLQLTGLGSLRPNTCVLAWPDSRRLTHERALRFLEFIARAAVNEKAVLALKMHGPRFAPFPASNQVMRGTMDVYWLLHDGGILILVSYLLKRHATWRHCTLRIFTVVQGGEREVLKTQIELTQYLIALRIKAEVVVIGLALQELGAWGGDDWTVRRRRTEGPDQRSLTGVFGAAAGGADGAQPPPVGQPQRSPSGLGGAVHMDEGSKIQAAIEEHSRNAALVLINLPPPPKSAWVNPTPYFQLVESLTAELQRVILVYGSGVECLTTYI